MLQDYLELNYSCVFANQTAKTWPVEEEMHHRQQRLWQLAAIPSINRVSISGIVPQNGYTMIYKLIACGN